MVPTCQKMLCKSLKYISTDQELKVILSAYVTVGIILSRTYLNELDTA